jgi:cell division protein FtsZ
MSEKRTTMTENVPETNIRFLFEEGMRTGACIKVVGVGGGGSNAVNRRIDYSGSRRRGVPRTNTDVQALKQSKPP